MMQRVCNRSSHNSLDQRCRMHHWHGRVNNWQSRVHHRCAGHIGLNHWSGVYDWSSGIGVNHWCGVNGLDHWSRVGLNNWDGGYGHLVQQVGVTLVGDGRGGAMINVGGFGHYSGLDNGVGLGNQTRSGSSHSQNSKESNLKFKNYVFLKQDFLNFKDVCISCQTYKSEHFVSSF